MDSNKKESSSSAFLAPLPPVPSAHRGAASGSASSEPSSSTTNCRGFLAPSATPNMAGINSPSHVTAAEADTPQLFIGPKREQYRVPSWAARCTSTHTRLDAQSKSKNSDAGNTSVTTDSSEHVGESVPIAAALQSLTLDIVKDGVRKDVFDLLGLMAGPAGTSTGAQGSADHQQQSALVRHGVVTLGKDPAENTVVCEHGSISKVHCLLQIGQHRSTQLSAPVQQPVGSASAAGMGVLGSHTCSLPFSTPAAASTKSSSSPKGDDDLYSLLTGRVDADDDDEDQSEDKQSGETDDAGNKRRASANTGTSANHSDLVSCVCLYDLGSSNGTYLVGQTARIPARTHIPLENGAMFRVGASTRLYRVQWSVATPDANKTARQISASSSSSETKPQGSRKRGRAGSREASPDTDEEKESGKVSVSYQKYIEHKQRVETFGIRRDDFDESDSLFDRASSFSAVASSGSSSTRFASMTFAQLQTTIQTLQEELKDIGTVPKDEGALVRQRGLQVELEQANDALLRLKATAH